MNLAVDRLVEYGLITNVGKARIHLDVPAWPDTAASAVVLDAHPLVREHFEKRLKGEGGRMNESEDSSFNLPPSSFQSAHRRLYEHLKQSAPELPDNLNDMMPLYHAVAHMDARRVDLTADAFIGMSFIARIIREKKASSAHAKLRGVRCRSLRVISSYLPTDLARFSEPKENLPQQVDFSLF